jgi:sugar phosphate isomerase/epimerase
MTFLRPTNTASGHGTQRPLLAASAKWFQTIDRLHDLMSRGLGIEYTPDPEDFSAMPALLRPFLERKIPLRFHAFFPEHEIGDQDGDAAAEAMDHHIRFLETVASMVVEPVITCHLGLIAERPMEINRAGDNLGLLVRRAEELGITLSLENLRKGPASNPEQIWKWAEAAGSALTLDIGHALSSKMVKEGMMTMAEIINLFTPRIIEAHYYEKESDRHYPPQDMQILGPVVDLLLHTPCRWWTIELEDLSDIDRTVELTRGYLAWE